MKSNLLKVVTVLALMFNLLPAGAAFAKHENETKFTGVVQSLPSGGFVGDWNIDGRVVHVTNATEVNQEDGAIVVGSTVKVEGRGRSDGSVDATEIELREGNSGGGNGGNGGSGGSGGGSGQGEVNFKGTIESFAAGFIGDWVVGGRTIHVTNSTRIEREFGPVAVGAFVEIKGSPRADGSMDATKIEIKSNVGGGDGRDEIKGAVESLPGTANFVGDWRVLGRTVHVTAETLINQEHGPVALGAFVEVNGVLRADGSIDATRIEVKPGVDNSDGQKDDFKGTIESLPNTAGLIGDWTIGGRTVHVISSTKLKSEHGAFAVGTRVKVKGIQMADQSVVATKIQVRDSN